VLSRRPRARALVAYTFVGVAALTLAAPLSGAQEVLLSPEQALKEIFPEGARTALERRPIDAATRARLEKQLGRHIAEDAVDVTRVFDAGGAFRGYAVITEEIGKYQPITFMVGVTPELSVRDVAVLVYRESRGGDVKRKRFLSQYRGKTVRDPIDANRDVINISGATISVRSMNAGVKRVLAELTALYASPVAAAPR
jgi:Na+-translocating ferredoxin:NAD+ oxidoreductase RnfG subunit